MHIGSTLTEAVEFITAAEVRLSDPDSVDAVLKSELERTDRPVSPRVSELHHYRSLRNVGRAIRPQHLLPAS